MSDNWIKAFDELEVFYEYVGLSQKGVWEPLGLNKEQEKVIKSFISQVEKDAIEKTNKRWRERCEKLKLEYERRYLKPWPLNDYGKGRIDALSDLLEDKQ